MDLTQCKEKYGEACVNEALDALLISPMMYNEEDWRMFCVRYGVVTQSTKTIRVVALCYQAWNMKYRLVLKNGRGNWVFHLEFTPEQLEAYRKGE